MANDTQCVGGKFRLRLRPTLPLQNLNPTLAIVLGVFLATFLADSGEEGPNIKILGGWTLTTVAEIMKFWELMVVINLK